MEIVCRSSGIVAADFPRQGIGDVAKAGFAEMMLDLSGYCLRQDLEEFGRAGRKRKSAEVLKDPSLLERMVREAAEDCQQSSLAVSAMYVPVLRRDTKRTDLNGMLERLTREAIRLCGMHRVTYLVIRPLFAGLEKDAL